jgi:DNA-binding NtrC family response regulator
MKEKRTLVWLSAKDSGFKPGAVGLQEWQLIPVAIDAEVHPDAIPDDGTWVGVLDLTTMSGDQLARVSVWLEALGVTHWIAVVEPRQVDNPDVCELINRYCEDYHTLPILLESFHGMLGHLWGMSELKARASCAAPLSYHDICLEGLSPAIKQTKRLLGKFAYTEEPVLIYGETGTGKEAAARFIHDHSPRRNKPLVIINCAALPPSLTQNELFGHEKGSFTHAMSPKKGKIETADGGTLLFIGVDELNLQQQSAILRFLQEGYIERIGGYHTIKVDARLIATSTSSLEQLVASERFRGDVFYRLGSLHVPLPPLRERREDILMLANRMLSSTPLSAGPKRLDNATAVRLAEHSWPGNLRELQNRLRQALLLGDGLAIDPVTMGFAQTPANSCERSQELSLDAFRSMADRQAISVSLALAENNISAAARLLNISRVSFYRLMDKYQVLQRTSVSPSKSR